MFRISKHTGTQFSSLTSVRVEDVENGVNDVRDEVDVALAASSSCVHAEGLLHSKAQEQQLGIVNVELVRGFPLPCALLQICVVPVTVQNELNILQIFRSTS